MDIALVHGISLAQVYESVNLVIDAVNTTSILDIKFPTDHTDQKKIAKGFEDVSDVGFNNCCGCIDGILIWTWRPSEKECEKVNCGQKKFFCGRKKNLALICKVYLM